MKKLSAGFLFIALLAAACVQPDYSKYPVNIQEGNHSFPVQQEQERQSGFAEEKSSVSGFSGMPSCGPDVFSVSPVALQNLNSITPLGNLNPPAHTFPTQHLYFNIISEGPGHESAKRVSVYAPADMKITKILFSEYVGTGTGDWSLEFAPCREVSGYFHHLSSASSAVKERFKEPFDFCQTYTTGGTTIKLCSVSVDFDVKAGEVLGTAGGVQTIQFGTSNALDLGVYDERAQALQYVNPSRYRPEQFHVVCPLDYFVPDIRAKLKSLLGYDSERRTSEPVCGKVMQDIAGTAQGNWFSVTEGHGEDPHIALVHDNIDPRRPVFSVGNSIPSLSPGLYYFDPRQSGSVNRDFGEAGGGIYCYESLEDRFGSPRPGIILLALDDNSLFIEGRSASSCGSGPWAFSDAAEFQR